jgi:glycosyltransferase involved in cell wall biosynthesis
VKEKLGRLLVINQYYAPDLASTGQLAAELCEGLVRRGFEMHVVTGRPSYSPGSPEAPAFEERNGVQVHRVPIWLKGRERMSTRLLGYLQFLWGAWRRARHLLKDKPFDVVLTFHNPPFVAAVGAYLARRHKLRYVYVLYDIHPDILIATGWRLPRLVIRLWEAANRWIFANAEHIVVLGEGMKQTLVEGKGVPPGKVQAIPLWGRPELEPLPKGQSARVRRELGLGKDELLLLYSGNMGIMHPLDPILDAAVLLQGEPVLFLFVGDGAKREALLRRVEREGLENVKFLPFQPEERFVQLVAAADACFVVLEPGLERLALPSRAFTFLSAGRPLITLMSSEAEIAHLVREAGCGWNATTAQELVGLVRHLLSHPEELAQKRAAAREAYERNFLRKGILDRYAKVLQVK